MENMTHLISFCYLFDFWRMIYFSGEFSSALYIIDNTIVPGSDFVCCSVFSNCACKEHNQVNWGNEEYLAASLL